MHRSKSITSLSLKHGLYRYGLYKSYRYSFTKHNFSNTSSNPFGVSHKETSQYWLNKRKNLRKMELGDIVLYSLSVWVTFFGLAYASAPLYRSLCQRFGWGGTINRKVDNKLKNLTKWRANSKHKKKNKKLLIRFDTRTGPGMEWDFEPVQSYVITRPGESTLAFFKATNTSSVPISGLSTYTILPYKAAPHFVKIQCFCFEEQRLRGHEEVDMPVLFFVEPDFLDDPALHDVEEITLSYIFYPVIEESGPIEYDDFDNDPFYNDDIDIDHLKDNNTNNSAEDNAILSSPSLEPQLQA